MLELHLKQTRLSLLTALRHSRRLAPHSTPTLERPHDSPDTPLDDALIDGVRKGDYPPGFHNWPEADRNRAFAAAARRANKGKNGHPTNRQNCQNPVMSVLSVVMRAKKQKKIAWHGMSLGRLSPPCRRSWLSIPACFRSAIGDYVLDVCRPATSPARFRCRLRARWSCVDCRQPGRG